MPISRIRNAMNDHIEPGAPDRRYVLMADFSALSRTIAAILRTLRCGSYCVYPCIFRITGLRIRSRPYKR